MHSDDRQKKTHKRNIKCGSLFTYTNNIGPDPHESVKSQLKHFLRKQIGQSVSKPTFMYSIAFPNGCRINISNRYNKTLSRIKLWIIGTGFYNTQCYVKILTIIELLLNNLQTHFNYNDPNWNTGSTSCHLKKYHKNRSDFYSVKCSEVTNIKNTGGIENLLFEVGKIKSLKSF